MVVATQEKRAATKEQAVPARKDEQALQQIQVALKQMIESVYTDGIDRLLNAYIDKDGNIAGKFADAGQIYDFTLSEDGQIDYVEGRLTNDSLQQWISSVRFDAPAAPGGKKKRKCTTGKVCKNTCIAKGLKCSEAIAPSLQRQIPGLKQVISAAQDGTTKSSPPASPGSKGAKTAALSGIAAGAALLGVSLAAYRKTVDDYRAGLDRSVEKAFKEAEEYDIPDEVKSGLRVSPIAEKNGKKGISLKKEPEQITLVVNGFSGTGGDAGDYFGAQLTRKFKGHLTVGIENPEFDIKGEAEDEVGINIDRVKTMMKSVVKDKENPVAIRMAARAYAYHKKTGKPINLVGVSAGGMATYEAAEILKRMGVKDVRVANMGSPHYGLMPIPERAVNFVSDQDPIVEYPGMKTPVNKSTNSVQGHLSYIAHVERTPIVEYSPVLKQNILKGFDQKTSYNKEVIDELTSFFDRSKKDSRFMDEPGRGAAVTSPHRFVVSAINSIYLDKLDRLLSASVNDRDEIVGLFLDENQVYEYKILPDGRLEYVESKQKFDSYLEGYGVQRSDAPKKRRCKIGKVCGNTCIAKGLKCKQILSPKLSQQLPMVRSALRQPESVVIPGAERQVKDPLETMTIRELKKEASTRGISRYNVMTKEELLGAIKAADADPEQQERLRRTLERRQKEQELDPAKSWKRIVRSRRRWGRNDLEAAWSAGSVLLGVSIAAYGWMKNRYQGNFAKSANAAINRSRSIETPNVGNKKYVTFTVDGFSAEADPNKGRNVSTALNNTDPAKMKSHHIVPIDGGEFTDLASMPVDMPAAIKTPAAIVLSTAKALKTTLVDGSNPQSVELAAQILAYKKKYPDKRMNLVGHGAGGQVVNEAIEILHLADPRLASDLRVVNIGTPNFGLTQQRAGVSLGNRSSRGRTITVSSANDPLDIFPKINPTMVNTVASHDINAYLGDERASKVIMEAINDPPVPRPSKKIPPKKRSRQDSVLSV